VQAEQAAEIFKAAVVRAATEAAAAAAVLDATRGSERGSSVQLSSSQSSSMAPAASQLALLALMQPQMFPADPSQSPEVRISATPSLSAAAAAASPPIAAVPKDKVPRGTVPPIDPVQSTATPGQLNPSTQDFMSFALAVWMHGPKLTDALTRFGDDDVACVAYLRLQLRHRR
jgi:hypothetical protein